MLFFFAGMSSNENNLLVSIWAGKWEEGYWKREKSEWLWYLLDIFS